MSSAVRLPAAPLTPAVVRHMLGWSQIQVAALAGVGVSSVRLYELRPDALSPETSQALGRAYAKMRALVLER